MQYFCFMSCVTDLVFDPVTREAATPYKNRFGEDFRGPQIPLGAEVQYVPITKKDKKRLHEFGSKTLRGIFAGYYQREGGGWSGDLKIIDAEELMQADSAKRVHFKRFKADELSLIHI